jgi:uncharacterized damage-inducible protein DinB
MHLRTEEVLSFIDRQRKELRAAIDSIPAAARNTQPTANQWSVAQVLDHLTIVETRIAAGVGKWIADAQANGLAQETETTSVAGTIPNEKILDRSRKVEAPEAIRPRTDVDAETAWTELEQARAKLRAAFLTGDGFALGQVVQTHPVLGPINVYQWMLFCASHEGRHTLQIREIAQQLNSAEGATA